MNCVGNRIKDRSVEVGLATFTGSNASHDIRSIVDHLPGVKRAFAARKALDQYFGVFIYENTHKEL
jgi:hypothetical protein